MKRQESFSKFDRAKRKVEKLKGFYTHLGIFLVINILITGFKVSNKLDSWDAFITKMRSLDVLSSWTVWGIILLIHALTVFVFPNIMGYDWEERKIKQLMEEELNSKD
ncbi:MAG: 2TM domain-containing protein [Winogradskyella sp.]|uniref:2TM domain-containing protein n=1 Tax=Winogradskyella sp. TaxID=1883156 RepID=UPI001823E264|nr:2TM domain-containing protein [Winogradskyella sp.]MBT8243776.1 2TM domain-containing protein [Winogradskyella sp.]NNK22032.1 2TM domain-containing protein [Winogradskyella sp.]